MLLSTILLERGYTVQELTPNPNIFQGLHNIKIGNNKNLVILNWNANEILYNKNLLLLHLKKGLSKIIDHWICTGNRYYLNEDESKISNNINYYQKSRKKILQKTVPPLYILSERITRKIRFCMAEDQLLDPIRAAHQIISALNYTKTKPDFIINMYLDIFKKADYYWQNYERVLQVPWGGIQFAPQINILESQGYNNLSNMKGIFLLCEGIIDKYIDTYPNKKIVFIPDITYSELPEQKPEIVKEIIIKSKGRKIIFLGGSIGAQKNLLQWTKLIQLADPTIWFFVQIGEVHYGTLANMEKNSFLSLKEEYRENFFLYEDYISDERVFNSIIAISDIIFAVYRNFPNSSNMLGKAAAFKKPILVSNEYLMGQRVKKYGIGRVVSETNPVAMMEAINDIMINPVPDKNYSDYLADFNTQKMGDAIEDLINYSLVNNDE